MSVLPLVRQWAVDWLNGRHPEVCEQMLTPDYSLLIGGYTLGPRDVYIPATLTQLARYPGLVVTVHHVVHAVDQVALVFSEHGASARLEGRAAAWSGVALFAGDAAGISRCWAEEDYWARRRQLDSAFADPVAPPAVAPWDTPIADADPGVEAVVRAWLEGPRLRSVPVVCDDEATGQAPVDLLEVQSCRVDALFGAGDQVAFHVGQTGTYVGGLAGLDDFVGRQANVETAGIVTVRDGNVVAGRVVRDRLGTVRTLQSAGS